MDDCIAKPVDTDHLIHTLFKVMQGRETHIENREDTQKQSPYVYLHPERLLNALNNNQDIFIEILESYMNIAPELIQRVATAMKKIDDPPDDNPDAADLDAGSDLNQMLKDIHHLTGMLGTMRAKIPHQRSFQLESSGKDGEIKKMKVIFPEFKESVDRLTLEVRQILDSKNTTKNSTKNNTGMS